jgi:hypothetical protein
MDRSPLAVRKLVVGLIALACLATSAALWLFADDPQTNAANAVATRLGIMLGALWLALPSRGESVAWGRALPAIFAVIVVLAVIRVKWQVLVYAIPVAIVLAIAAAFIRPRSKPRPPRQQES